MVQRYAPDPLHFSVLLHPSKKAEACSEVILYCIILNFLIVVRNGNEHDYMKDAN